MVNNFKLKLVKFLKFLYIFITFLIFLDYIQIQGFFIKSNSIYSPTLNYFIL